MSKQYGLIKPKPQARFNVFGSSSSDDDEKGGKKTKKLSLGQSITQKKQIKMIQEQAIEEDPSIFQYDEVYEDIQTKRKEEKEARKTADAKKPRYIVKLLETAEKRKLEHERRIERQVQKEREAEGEEFKDKEAFVTSSYMKKLEEIKQAEELEKREAYLESIGDVTKQQDLSGFYRHLYSQKLGDVPKESTSKDTTTAETETAAAAAANKKKNYRKRKSSNEEEEKEEPDTKKSDHLLSNLDADSDFSIESSDSENETKEVKVKEEKIEDESESKNEEMPPAVEIKDEKIEVEPPKVKIDIWKKRTVGDEFDKALQRYFERKATREQAA